ncbi:trigger factor [Flavobacteriaceae bacterium]|jgi:trigger factor|nr:trigger factor [Flavobacteriaceae bacterium]MDB4108721.1 trigger factor [Flavobacteriaceae bacterium]MDC0117844.1 trigger factor [bacterium]MDG1393663.1 trigger factor [Flavobacteriaceae bacterium]
MNITRESIDTLNAVVKIEVAKADYSDNVDKILANYRKTANIPGFRKGHVPMGFVKKQYGKAVLVDEVNKLIQEALGKYLTEEKLDVLGNPLPRSQDNLDWDKDDFSFEFEIGLSPEFEIKLKAKKALTKYTITADKKMIDDQLVNIQKQYGKLTAKSVVEQEDEVTGVFFNDAEGIEATATFTLDKLKGKSNTKAFLGANVDAVLTLDTKGLFADSHDLMTYLKVDHDTAHGLDVQVTFTISEVNSRELAEFDQELFDKLFGPGVVTSVTELRAKITEDAEKQFVQQADQKFLNDVTEHLVENTKFDLPTQFLQKWIQTAGDKELDVAQAKEEYEKSEKSMRYQLIESKLIVDNSLQVNFEDLKAYTSEMIKGQMAQYGQTNPTEKEIDDIVARVLSNQEEVKRISEQLTSQKLLDFYKENANFKDKKLTYEAFVKEVYGK